MNRQHAIRHMQDAKQESNWPLRAAIAIAVVIAFGASLGAQFVAWDDHDLITQNPKLNPPTPAGLAQLWRGPDHQMYIPVVDTAWWGLAHVPSGEPNALYPVGFHAANLLLHLLSAWIVFEILLLLVRSRWAACAGAMIFAVHPIQTEAVAWATGMKDVLSGFLALFAAWLYLAAWPNNSLRRYALATVLFALALLAKPSTVCLPAICIVLAWAMGRRPTIENLPVGDSKDAIENPDAAVPLVYRRKKVVGWIVLTIWFALAATAIFVATKVQPIPASLASPLRSRPLIALDAIVWYLMKIFWPVGFAVDYSRTPAAVIGSNFARYQLICVASLLIVVVRSRRRRIIAALFIYVAALLPVLGLSPFLFQKYSTVADRYAYLAMLAPALACAALLSRVDPRKWLAPAAVFVAILVVLSVRQTLVWHDTLSLFTHTLEVNPDSLAATRSLGFYWAEHDDDAQAAGYFETANRLHPEDSTNHFNYANLFLRHGLLDQALAHYQKAIAIDPGNAQYRLNYGVALVSADRTADALAAFQKAAKLNPSSADAWQNVGLACEKLGQTGAAKEAFTRALACDPSRTIARQHLSRLP